MTLIRVRWNLLRVHVFSNGSPGGIGLKYRLQSPGEIAASPRTVALEIGPVKSDVSIIINFFTSGVMGVNFSKVFLDCDTPDQTEQQNGLRTSGSACWTELKRKRLTSNAEKYVDGRFP
jgi:hypothetical protein